MSILAIYDGGDLQCPRRVLTHLEDIQCALQERGLSLTIADAEPQSAAVSRIHDAHARFNDDRDLDAMLRQWLGQEDKTQRLITSTNKHGNKHAWPLTEFCFTSVTLKMFVWLDHLGL